MLNASIDHMTPDRTKAARELLAFYLEAGVDALVGETPVDHLAPRRRPPAAGDAISADAGFAPPGRARRSARPQLAPQLACRRTAAAALHAACLPPTPP